MSPKRRPSARSERMCRATSCASIRIASSLSALAAASSGWSNSAAGLPSPSSRSGWSGSRAASHFTIQPGQPPAGHERIRIDHGGDDATHPGRDEHLGARRRAAMVVARLQRHIDGSAARGTTGGAQGMNLGVRFAGPLVPAFADDHPRRDDHASHPRIGRGRVEATSGEPQRPRHMAVIVDPEIHQRAAAVRRRLGAGFATSSIASRKSSTSWKLRYTEAKRM